MTRVVGLASGDLNRMINKEEMIMTLAEARARATEAARAACDASWQAHDWPVDDAVGKAAARAAWKRAERRAQYAHRRYKAAEGL